MGKIFNESGVEISGSYLSYGIGIQTPLASFEGEVGVANGAISANGNEVQAEGSILYVKNSIETAGNMADGSVKLATAEGNVTLDKTGNVSSDVNIGVADGEVNYQGKDGLIGGSFKLSALKVNLKANLTKVANAISETFEAFGELGAFDNMQITTPKPPREDEQY